MSRIAILCVAMLGAACAPSPAYLNQQIGKLDSVVSQAGKEHKEMCTAPESPAGQPVTPTPSAPSPTGPSASVAAPAPSPATVPPGPSPGPAPAPALSPQPAPGTPAAQPGPHAELPADCKPLMSCMERSRQAAKACQRAIDTAAEGDSPYSTQARSCDAQAEDALAICEGVGITPKLDKEKRRGRGR